MLESTGSTFGLETTIDLRDGASGPLCTVEVPSRRADTTDTLPSRPTRSAVRKVMLVGSSGGHLAQLLRLADNWDADSRVWVTFDTKDAVSQLEGQRTVWAHHPTTRSIPNLLRNTRLAIRTMRRERPDVVVSNGAAVALPFFLAARAMGIPTVYMEVIDRVDSATLTGRLCRPFSSAFCVQWAEQQPLYPGSVVVGHLM